MRGQGPAGRTFGARGGVAGRPRQVGTLSLMSLHLSLDDARDSLAYWERRQQTLPRRAVRARREARDMAERWRARVTEAERETYGAGLLGILLCLIFEQRLPEPARHAGRRAARVTVFAVAGVALTLLVTAMIAVALFLAVIIAIL